MDTTHLPPRCGALIKYWHTDLLDSRENILGCRKILVGKAAISFPEYIVFILTTSGLKPSAIAEFLKRSPATIDKHLQSVRVKLNAHTIVALVHIAIKNNLITPGEFTQI